MGPRSDERGNIAEQKRLLSSHRTSMGPRSDERGNSALSAVTSAGMSLQWGRVRMNAEMVGRSRLRQR